MSDESCIGIITPSGNRTVERVTQAICATLGTVVPVFTRIPVFGNTSPDRQAANPYDWPAMLQAAELLSHARPGAICWNGSKGGDYGFDIDAKLCADITQRTGLPAVTSALATLELLRRLDARRIALITPYTTAAQAKGIANFTAKGFEIAAERHAGLSDNFSYGGIAPEDVAAMARSAIAGQAVDAIVVFCTNLNGAPVVAELESQTGIPVVDSAAAGIWAALGAAGVATHAAASRWGRIFAL